MAVLNEVSPNTWVFDDFNWAGGTVEALFGNYASAQVFADSVIGMEFEIREGVGAANGGVLKASGFTANFTWASLGASFLGSDGYRGTADVADFVLAPGTYHFAVRPVFAVPDEELPFSYLVTTDGTNGIGTAGLDGNSFFTGDDSVTSFNFVTSESILDDPFLGLEGPWDFSQGIIGSSVVIPLPTGAAMGLAGITVVGLRRRR